MRTQLKVPAVAVVVNSEPAQVQVLTGLLEGNGLEVRAFDHAEAALAGMDRRNPPSLVVTGLRLPGVDGWRFCRLLRTPAYAAFNQVPILVVSATLAGEQASRIAADLGANAFLALPVAETEFAEQVQKLLRGESPPQLFGVLIVEDDNVQATVLKEEFEDHGYRADIALTGLEAQRKFQAGDYEAVILDHHLPDMAGNQLLGILKPLRPDTVFLAVTGDPDPKLALDWMRWGAAAFAGKPCAPEYIVELCAKARREQELLRNEYRFRSIFDNSLDGMLFAKPDGSIFAANRAACELLGRSEREICEGGHKLVADAADPRVAKAMEARARTGQFRGELNFRRRDGQAFPVTLSSTEFSLGSESLWSCIIFRDITERQRTAEALRQSEQRLALVLQATQEAFWDWDLAANTLFYSPAWWSLVGLAENELEADPALWRRLLHPEDLERADQAVATVLKEGASFQVEVRLLHKAGHFVPVQIRGFVLRDQCGKPLRVFGVNTSQAERHRAESER